MTRGGPVTSSYNGHTVVKASGYTNISPQSVADHLTVTDTLSDGNAVHGHVSFQFYERVTSSLGDSHWEWVDVHQHSTPDFQGGTRDYNYSSGLQGSSSRARVKSFACAPDGLAGPRFVFQLGLHLLRLLEPRVPGPMPLTTVSDVSIRRRGRSVIDGVSFGLQNRGLTLLGGENGAGKTSLILALSGLLAPSRGVITVRGHDVGTARGRKALGGSVTYLPSHRAAHGRSPSSTSCSTAPGSNAYRSPNGRRVPTAPSSAWTSPATDAIG